MVEAKGARAVEAGARRYIHFVTHANAIDRVGFIRRSRSLTTATLAYNSLEAIIAIVAGVSAGSIALVGFGFDSCYRALGGR
jgi:hypothetical protein